MTGRGREVDGDVAGRRPGGAGDERGAGGRRRWPATMARPRPCPSAWPVAVGPEPLERLEQPVDLVGGITGAGVADREAGPAATVADLDPAAVGCCGARRCRPGSPPGSRPGAGRRRPAAGASAVSTGCPRRSASGARLARTTVRVTRRGRPARRRSTPRSLVARVSSASISRSWLAEGQHLLAGRGSVSAVASGSASATWSSARSAVSGVRSSWEALATKWRCDSKDSFSRPNRSSRVVAELGELVVGAGRGRAGGAGCSAEMSRAVAVIVRSGRRNAAGDSQPSRGTDTAGRRARPPSSEQLRRGCRGRGGGWHRCGRLGAVCAGAGSGRSATASRTTPEAERARRTAARAGSAQPAPGPGRRDSGHGAPIR